MRIPTELKHKPVITADDYENIDGRAAYDSNAKGLSVGLAQWNMRGLVDVSAKIWRHTGGKWSRQSEEMPLHRLFDLCIFTCKALSFFRENYRFEKGYDPDAPVIGRVGLQGDAMTVSVCTENEHIVGDLALVRDALRRDDELLSERLRVLSGALKELGY